ncbi:MAG: DegV family protein [Lachnospiraceae bacterium]
MKQFVITSDSTVDLPKEYLEEHQNTMLSLSYLVEGKTYEDVHGLPSKEFYDKIRAGSQVITSQVNPEQAKKIFETLIKKGNDILHIAFSSGLSGSYNSAQLAAAELMEQYENIHIEVIDSLSASMGEGLLLYKANEMKQAGRSLDEIASWLNQNKLHVCHNFTVDDLNHLQRGGRISKATAVIGTAVNIKPILHVDNEGHLVNIGKVRGRKKSLLTLVEHMEKQAKGYENNVVMISHGDCIEDAKLVESCVRERLGIENIIIHPVGAVIGTHSGPGTIALFFMGNPR